MLMNSVLMLFILAIPIACITWTFTHEKIFEESQEYIQKRIKKASSKLTHKFFYMLSCEYCLSHYITILFLVLTKYSLFYPDWRGYIISGFSLVFIANVYMGLFRMLRLDIKIAHKESKQ